MGKVSMRIGHLKITDHLILGITKHKLDHGMETFQSADLQLVSLAGWPDMVSKLDGGDLDGAFILAPSAMDLVRSGLGVKMVLLGHKTGSIFVKRKGAKIDNIKDFKGLTVIIPYQMSVHYMLLHQMLTQGGLVPHVDVKFETLAPVQMPEALEFGEEDGIGGFIVAEPYGSYSIKMGFGDVFALSKDLWPKHPCCIFVLKDAMIQNHPDAVQEVVNSLVASGKLKSSNLDLATDIGAAFLGQDKDLIKGVLSTPPDRIITEELLPRPEDFEKMQNYMVDQMKILKGKIDLEKFIDARFAKTAGAS